MGQGPSAEANFIINARLSQSSVQQVTQQINQLIEQNQNRTLNFKVNWSTGRGGGVSSAANVASQSSAAGRVAPPVIPAQVMESALAGQLPGQTAGYWAQGASPVAGGFGIPPSGYEGAWSTSGTYNFVNRSARGPGGRFIDYASWRAQQQANTEYSYAGIGRDIDEVASQIGDLFVKHFTAPDRATAKVFR